MLWLEGEPQKTVVFVTHDIDEALLLSNRVIFMQPGKIIRDIHIPFAQPRDKEDIFYTPEYRELKQQLLALFNLNPELNIHAQK
jgi:NitT/TauT family transport system ATP-binding protein